MQPCQRLGEVPPSGQVEPPSREVRFEVDPASSTATAAACGGLSPSALADLGALLRKSLADGCRSLVLDLAHCTDFPPHGAGILNRLADEAHAVGSRLTIHGVPSFDAMMLRADGLAADIDIVPRNEARLIDASSVGVGDS